MEIFNPFPIYNGEGFGFLSPLFESLIFEGGECFPSIQEYCSVKRVPLKDGYEKLFEQYPKYKRIVQKNNLSLWINGENLKIINIIDKIEKKERKQRLFCSEEVFGENIKEWVKIVELACQKECILLPSEDLLFEILDQNKMGKHKKHLLKNSKENITKKELSIITSLPFGYPVNRGIFFLSKYKGVAKKYSCRHKKLEFRKECSKRKALSLKSFLRGVKDLGLDPEILEKVLKSPKKYSLYELKLYLMNRK